MDEDRLTKIRAAMEDCDLVTVPVYVLSVSAPFEFDGQYSSIVALGSFVEPRVVEATGLSDFQYEWLHDWFDAFPDAGHWIKITCCDYTAEQLAAVDVEP